MIREIRNRVVAYVIFSVINNKQFVQPQSIAKTEKLSMNNMVTTSNFGKDKASPSTKSLPQKMPTSNNLEIYQNRSQVNSTIKNGDTILFNMGNIFLSKNNQIKV